MLEYVCYATLFVCDISRQSLLQRKATGSKVGCVSPSKLVISENKYLLNCGIKVNFCLGVLWLGNSVIPGSPDVISHLQKIGKRVFYVSNNSSKTREEFVSKFSRLGYPASKVSVSLFTLILIIQFMLYFNKAVTFFVHCTENILCTAYLTACYLQDICFKKKVYVVGSKGITDELDATSIKHLDVGPDPMCSDMTTLLKNEVQLDPDVGAVVVGFDEHFSFPKMVKAASYLRQPDCLFIGTNTDEVFPSEFPLTVPGTGTFVKAIETCTNRQAFKIGKPSPYVCEAIINRHQVDPSKTLMIGDRQPVPRNVFRNLQTGFHSDVILAYDSFSLTLAR
ncbi:hypothetical protein Cfor_09685 [Coptotermes formosanus]|uniref:Uncharacterized protein n=1 Tax=Coptotermes formosanus TaxID=36987 RepID=A0A6L2PE52_COPFO|nr:hypothetical protein Cfor_09685 [Coptotermes formosanus]